MGRRGIVRGLIVGLSAFVMAFAVYVAIVVIGPFDFPWQRITAMIQLGRPVVEGGNLRMSGTTDLPDGALIDYHFWSHDTIGEGPVGAAEVKNGRFSFEEDVSGLRAGTWTVELSFSTVWGSQQPTHVSDLFGSEGEHLAGPQVYVDSPGDAKQLYVSTDVEIPRADQH